jgi:mRNA-degrading endonuclease RelE of RelBE toxin-antitoxin system
LKRLSRRIKRVYTLKFTDDGLHDVRALPKNERNVLKRELKEKLAKDPFNCTTPLRGVLEGWRSFLWDNRRVVVKVYDDLRAVAIAGVGERKHTSGEDIYRKLEALAIKGKLAEQVLITLRGFTQPQNASNPREAHGVVHVPSTHRIRRRTHKSSSIS